MITPSFGLTATERVLPRLALDFTTASLDSRITFTRALNTATRVNSSGYIETVNADVARFDYDPITLACKGLLIEESRTNTLAYSQEFDNAVWDKIGATISVNAVVSPSGFQDADKLIDDTSTGNHTVYKSNYSFTAAPHTASVYAKAAGRDFIHLIMYDGAQLFSAYFDLTNGTVGTVSGSGTATTISNMGNGWYRCTITATPLAATGSYNIRSATANNVDSYTGDGISGVYLWGAQLEAGAFPTSYIPTTTTSLTRNADVATMTGTNFSSWFNASEGTFEVDFIQPFNYATNTYIFACNAATNDERLSFLTDSTPQAYWYCAAGGTDVAAITAGNITLNQVTKQVAAYKLDNYGMAVNGGNAGTDTSGAVPSGLSTLYFGTNVSGGNRWGGWVQKLKYWPQRLINNELSAFSK